MKSIPPARRAVTSVPIALDPIEKKPLYRFHPGSAILSLGSWGCNFTCPFCQNWQISQQEAPYRDVTPEQALALAQHYTANGSIGLAYTYNEPTLSYEFIIRTARLIHKAGLINVMVSNGYIEKEPLQALQPCRSDDTGHPRPERRRQPDASAGPMAGIPFAGYPLALDPLFPAVPLVYAGDAPGNDETAAGRGQPLSPLRLSGQCLTDGHRPRLNDYCKV